MKLSSRTGRILTYGGGLAVAAGTLYYGGILRQAQTATEQSPMETVRMLVLAAVIANLGAVALMAGLAALRDRVALRLAGLALAILLVALDYKVLDASLGRTPGYAVAALIGAAFLLIPWLPQRR